MKPFSWRREYGLDRIPGVRKTFGLNCRVAEVLNPVVGFAGCATE